MTVVVFSVLLLAAVGLVHGEIEDPNKVLSLIIKDLKAAPDGPAGDAINDHACDGLLSHINNEILRQSRSIVPLPDINERVDKSVSAMTLKGTVSARQGRIGNLATIKRLSGTSVKKSPDGNKIQVGVIVGLGSFSLQYQDYESDLSGAKHKGRIDVFVQKHSALFKVTVEIQGSGCTITLDKFQIKELDDIKVIIEPTNPYLTSYLNWYMDNKKQEKIKQIEDRLFEGGQKALQSFKCNLSL